MRRFGMTALGLAVGTAIATPVVVVPEAHAVQPASCAKTFTVSSGSWVADASWTPAGAPSASDDVCIPNGDTATITGTDVAQAHTVNAVSGTQGQGTLQMTGGSLTIGGDTDTQASSLATLTWSGGTIVSATAPAVSSDATVALNATSTTMSGMPTIGVLVIGPITWQDGVGAKVVAGGRLRGAGSMQSGTISTDDAHAWVYESRGLTKSGAGIFTLSNGAMDIIQGSTQIQAGSFIATDTTIGVYDSSNVGFTCGGCGLFVDAGATFASSGGLAAIHNAALYVSQGGTASATNGCALDNGAAFDIAGSLTCDIVIADVGASEAGGSLRGIGTIAGTLSASVGSVYPGQTSLGGTGDHLTLTGALTLSGTALAGYRITDTSTYTYLNAGTAALSGRTAVQRLGGTINQGDTFRVIRTAGGASGSTTIQPDISTDSVLFTGSVVGNDYVLNACDQTHGCGSGIPVCPPVCPTPTPTPSTSPTPSPAASSKPLPPGAPTATTLTSGDASLTVAFTAPTSGGGGITGYTATATPVNAATGQVKVTAGTASPITVGGLVDGAAYVVTVHATNAGGSGPESNGLEGIAGNLTGVSLLLSQNPVPVGHPLRFYGYAADHGAPVKNQKVALYQRLAKGQNTKLATVLTDASGQYTYNLRLVHTGAVRALTVIGGKSIYSKELLAKVAFVLLKVKATLTHGHIVITGAITPGSPSPFGEAPDRVAIYKATADGKKGAYIGDAKLATTAKGAPSTDFTYDHKASVLGSATYVYVNPVGTRANTSTHVTVRVH